MAALTRAGMPALRPASAQRRPAAALPRAALQPRAAPAPAPRRFAPVAPVSAPSPCAPARGDAQQCEALGLGAISAGIAKFLGWLGIKGTSAAAIQSAATSAAAGAGKAALVAAFGAALMKYFFWAALAFTIIGLAAGTALSYFGIPQVAVQQVQTLLGAPKLKLWTNAASRGQIVSWYAKELGVEVEAVEMDMKEKREHKSPEFLKVNPFGKLPAISDGEFNLFESGALLTYLADKYPLQSGIITPQQRAAAAQWVLFANSTLANSVFVEQFREKAFPDVFSSLDKILADKEYLEGGKFSVSDVAVGAYLLYIPAFLPQLDLTPYPNVLAYMERLKQRPACAATVAARAGAKKEETEAAAAEESAVASSAA